MKKEKNEQLINENYDNVYNLAKSLSKAYGLSFESFEDLQKAGYISLIEQFENFDEIKGIPFWTYAYNGVD